MVNEIKTRKEGRSHGNFNRGSGRQDGHAGNDGRVQEDGNSGGPHRMLGSMAGSWNTQIHEDVRNNKKKDSHHNGFSIIL